MKGGGTLGFLDYVREAFFRRVHLPLLGRMPVNLMALAVTGVLGLANPGFWLLGLALEVGYLTGVAGSSRFQKLIQGERLLAAQEVWQAGVSTAVSRLEPPSRERYQRLLEQCRRILGLSETLSGGDTLGSFRDLHTRNLNQLLGIFLRLLASREVIEDNIRNLDPDTLAAEIEELEKRLADAGPHEALARSISGTLDIQRRRLSNLDKAEESLKVIDAELLRIEQQVELLREESALSGGPAALSERLDTVTSVMGETTRWIDEQSGLLGSLAGTETTSPVPNLPDLPQLPRLTEEG